MKLLADYVDFSGLQAGTTEPAAQNGTDSAIAIGCSCAAAASPTAQLKRGMTMDEVSSLLGQERLLSESASSDGLKTQVFEYLSGDRRVEETYVEGLVVRFSINSK